MCVNSEKFPEMKGMLQPFISGASQQVQQERSTLMLKRNVESLMISWVLLLGLLIVGLLRF